MTLSLINSLGNVPPPSVASVVGATIVWDNAMGTGSGVVLSATTSAIGAITGYNLASGQYIPINEVTNFNPPGFTVVR